MKRITGLVVAFFVAGAMGAVIMMISVVSMVFVSGASACSSQSSANLPPATVDYLNGRNVKELADQNKERYLYAQQQTGVPWQVMAALHYREAGMNPKSSISNGAPLGSGVNVDGVNVVSNANQDAANMAALFKRLALGVYHVDVVGHLNEMTIDDWGEAFLAYNRGYLYKDHDVSYTQSPYVMNGIDSGHMNMRWTYADTVEGTDGNKAGALTIMEYLGGVSIVGTSHPSGCVGTVVAPTDGKTLLITSGFGSRTMDGTTRVHQGLDIIGGTVDRAAMAGTVIFAGEDGTCGWTVKLDHGNGNYTMYCHMVAHSIVVTKGESVIAGQTLGTMGATGDATGVHLHFQVWVNNQIINPYNFLTDHGIKLGWAPGADTINTKPGPL